MEYKEKSLNEVAKFSQGIQVSIENQYNVNNKGTIRFLRIIDYTQNADDIRYVDILSEKYTVSSEDIVMVRYGASSGFVGTGLEGVIANNMFKIIPNEHISKRFLYYFLSQDKIKKFLMNKSSASAMPAINFGMLADIKVPILGLDIQEKTCKALDKAQELIDKRKAQIEELDKLIKSTFYDMFGDPVINPKGWKKGKLSTKIELISGFAFKSKEYVKDRKQIKLCGGLIIMPNRIEWENSNYWSNEKVEGMDKYFLKENDVVMALDRPWISSGFKLGVIKKDDLPALLVQRTACLRCKDMNNHFLYNILKDKSFEIHCKPTETTVPHISTKDIQSLETILPPIDIQYKFGEIVERIERQKKQIKQSLSELENNFNSLMQKAFKGELFN